MQKYIKITKTNNRNFMIIEGKKPTTGSIDTPTSLSSMIILSLKHISLYWNSGHTLVLSMTLLLLCDSPSLYFQSESIIRPFGALTEASKFIKGSNL
jgi:hypothetical protein